MEAIQETREYQAKVIAGLSGLAGDYLEKLNSWETLLEHCISDVPLMLEYEHREDFVGSAKLLKGQLDLLLSTHERILADYRKLVFGKE